MQGINSPAMSLCQYTLIVLASCVSSSTKRIRTVSACRMVKDNKVKRYGIQSSRLILLTSGETSAESIWLYIDHTLQPGYTPTSPLFGGPGGAVFTSARLQHLDRIWVFSEVHLITQTGRELKHETYERNVWVPEIWRRQSSLKCCFDGSPGSLYCAYLIKREISTLFAMY